MHVRQLLAILAVVSAAPGAQAQGGLTDMFRSITGALRGGRETAPQQQGVTATIGVRGMDEADAQAAAPAAGGDYALMEGWAATRPEAERAAGSKGLAARAVTLKTGETRSAPAGN